MSEHQLVASDRVVVAEIVRPRGLRGELIVRSETDIPGRFERLVAQARLRNGSDVPVRVEKAWQHKGDWILKFVGVDTIDAAEIYRGADVWVPLQDRARLESGEFYRSDLLGCRLVARAGGEIGVVEGWQQYGGAAPLMEVRLTETGTERLVPFVPAFCEVDLAARVITVDLPAGLLDLP